MATVSRALSRIKQDLGAHLPPTAIESACRAAGHRWRERKLGPVLTLHLFVLQILHGNAAIRHLRHLARAPLNAAAYCRARARLPLAALQQLLRDSSATLRRELAQDDDDDDAQDLTRWRGHRAYVLDGSASIVPDEPPLRAAFGQPRGRRAGCGLPVPKVLGLFDAMTGLIVEIVGFALFVHEHARAWTLHPLLHAGDVLVGDRGFCSYVQLALLAERGVLAVMRMRKTQIVNFRPHRKHFRHGGASSKLAAQRGRPRSRYVRRLGRRDQVVAWLRPRYCAGPRTWMARGQFEALPAELLVRELRYTVTARGRRARQVTVATTLLDAAAYPKQAIAELYGMRWQVETHWRELKTVMRMRRLKCRTVAGVHKELAAYALAYNLVRAVMVRAAARQRTAVDRISFTDALCWLLNARPGEALSGDLVANPRRPCRCEPRVIKDHFETYPRMSRPRAELRATINGGRR
jgi:hypothetical protein